jgi:hypothetical protein
VTTATTDEDGFFAIPFKHTGPRTWYSVQLTGQYDLTERIQLKANAFAEVSFDIPSGCFLSDCYGRGEDLESEADRDEDGSIRQFGF